MKLWDVDFDALTGKIWVLDKRFDTDICAMELPPFRLGLRADDLEDKTKEELKQLVYAYCKEELMKLGLM